jgi:hypothetical protein
MQCSCRCFSRAWRANSGSAVSIMVYRAEAPSSRVRHDLYENGNEPASYSYDIGQNRYGREGLKEGEETDRQTDRRRDRVIRQTRLTDHQLSVGLPLLSACLCTPRVSHSNKADDNQSRTIQVARGEMGTIGLVFTCVRFLLLLLLLLLLLRSEASMTKSQPRNLTLC